MIVQCPFCHYKEAVPEEYAGMIGECSNCGKEFRIPGPRVLQHTKSAEEHPIICFVLGFFFSLIGILVAYIIDKKNVVKAVIGFIVNLILFVLGVGLIACSADRHSSIAEDAVRLYETRGTGSKVAGAADAISDNEGPKAKSSVEDLDEETIKNLGR